MIDNQTVKARLILFIKSQGIGQGRFEKVCGLSNGYVNNIRKSIQPEKLQQIALQYPTLNTGWLMTGEGEMLKREGVIPVSSNQINHEGQGTPVYDIDATCGGEFRDFQDDVIIGYVNLPTISKDAIIITASGNSMVPTIQNGDKIAIREIKSWDFIFFGQIYLVLASEYRMLKYIRKHPTDKDILILRSENNEYDDIELPKSEIKKLFIVENILSISNLM